MVATCILNGNDVYKKVHVHGVCSVYGVCGVCGGVVCSARSWLCAVSGSSGGLQNPSFFFLGILPPPHVYPGYRCKGSVCER